ncbi:EutN/CcmL family microcompartment protein [Tissierella sp. MB52-C2]|jgi:ethanolamine utilization protein EutN|uniref:EutN/CcmL family microcompartment protein n=1 Tax=Tissierella sp. MB52-C2 TaxID=3070999 RepID=UPI00280ADC48|nr:EutN/CcmL family microcompartment protein [Tissierella sp. MB52-C2]WMM25346.1 EutN/CcmL family microcompartment protein [Tissierella sp. MB52-C2]
MRIGRVIGTVVATRKDEKLIGTKLMITQPLDLDLKPKGESLIAVDTVGAGIGELIVFVTGTASRIAARKMDSPIDASIVGIIDEVDINKSLLGNE